MLEIEGLTKHFGGLAAVNNFDMKIEPGEIVGLIGPNGAGKTTVFNLITGFIPPTGGRVLLEKADVTGKPPHALAERGIVRTFQDTPFLPDFTVLENVLSSCFLHPKCNILEAILNTPGYRKKEQATFDRALALLKFLGLEALKDEPAQNLPLGHQRLLGIAIALSAAPKLLLLDEPLGGMNASEVSETMLLINKIRASGTTILLVEHNMRAVMESCDRIVVLNFGRKIAEGLAEKIRRNKEVIEAYLGTEHDATQS